MMLLFVVLAGFAFASFIGSLSYRAPRHISIIYPPSTCVHCKARLTPFELVPLVSYALLGGLCRYCGERISIRYPAAEIAVPSLYAVLYVRYGLGYLFYLHSYLLTVLVYLSIVDIEQRALGSPDIAAVYAGGAFNLVWALGGMTIFPVSHYLMGAAAALLLVGVSFSVTYLIKNRLPMGFADLLVIPGVGVYFGLQESLRIVLFSSICGTAAAAVLILSRVVDRRFRFPMMPFVSAGAILEILLF